MSVSLDRVAETACDFIAIMKYALLVTAFVASVFATTLAILNYWIPH